MDHRDALVRAAASGDRDSFGVLVEGCWNALVRFARSIVGDLEAEDAVQETLLIAWDKLPQLDDPRRFDAWVMQITFRRALRRLGRWRRRAERDGRQRHTDQAPGGQNAGIEVWSLLRHVAPRQRAVLHLTVVEGMTDSEVATVLGIRPSSVRAHRRRARERLSALLSTTEASAKRQ
ncbi:MAG: sigma-70 family RNA polymerase sigma factor [Acidobacteria bacterium]|nr:sigma-70 family RNA polymerase sigma factor [Acidobacteriota bacterium]